MKKAPLLVFAALLLAAKPTINPREDGAYSRAGQLAWGQFEDISAGGEWIATGTDPVDTGANGEENAPKLFEYGTIVMITCDAPALGFWAQDTGVTTTTDGLVTDAGSTSGRTSGPNGFWIEAGLTRHTVVPTPITSGDQGYWSESQVSTRRLSCEDPTSDSSDAARATAGRPCDTDADCFYGGTVTCSSSKQPEGSYLKIHPVTTAACYIEIER